MTVVKDNNAELKSNKLEGWILAIMAVGNDGDIFGDPPEFATSHFTEPLRTDPAGGGKKALL